MKQHEAASAKALLDGTLDETQTASTLLQDLQEDEATIFTLRQELAEMGNLQERIRKPAELALVAAEMHAEAKRQAKIAAIAEERLGNATRLIGRLKLDGGGVGSSLHQLSTFTELETAARLLAPHADDEGTSLLREDAASERASLSPSFARARDAAGAPSPEPVRAPGRRSDSSASEKEIVAPSGKIYAGTSFFCLLPGHQPRKFFIDVAESKLFDPLILLTILANCATMAWESPLDPEGTSKAAFIAVCEWVFLGIFTCEMFVKISAYGFICHREAYLHDAWCQLDFVVVTLAWLPILFPAMGNYSVLRAFRALRPLRALKRVPGMPLLVQWILSVLPKMANVLGLSTFVFLVFGIVGMELFKGTLHYRCALPGFEETPGHPISDLRRLEEFVVAPAQTSALRTILPLQAGKQRLLRGAHVEISSTGASSQLPFDTGFSCNPHHADGPHAGCEDFASGTTCAYFDSNPNHGMTSYDSVGMVFISYMQMTTFDDWANPMYDLMAAFSPNVWAYFVVITMVSGFFVVNLFLAVIFMEYRAAQELVKEDSTKRTARTSVRSGTAPSDHDSVHSGKVSVRSAASRKEDSDALVAGGVELSDGIVKPATAPRDWSDCSSEGAFRHPFLLMAESSWLGNTSTTLVIVNMVLMCMPYEGMMEEYAANLELAASYISWLFIIEMGVKLIGIGCSGYWSDGWNCLDGTIVSLSILEMVLTALLANLEGVNVSFFRILRMLRMLRVLRILRLMKSWKGLYKIIMTLIGTLPAMANLCFLIVLTMFMFALLGMQLFGGMFTEEAGYYEGECPGGVCPDGFLEKPYYHYDYCGPAMITIFILLTGEWIDAMEPVAAVQGMGTAAFFILVVMLGKYLLMNLLVAVILTEFSEEDEGPATSRSTARDSTSRSDTSIGSGRAGTQDGEGGHEEKSLYIFGPRHPVRRFCARIIKMPQFDQVVIGAIIISSICLAIDTPRLDSGSFTAATLKKLDLFFTALFFCEMSTKIIAYTFCTAKDAYIKSAWNQASMLRTPSHIVF